jgi:chemotaxis response regulator CheB
MASTMRILVIDDDAIFSRYLAEVLIPRPSAEWVTDGLLG